MRHAVKPAFRRAGKPDCGVSVLTKMPEQGSAKGAHEVPYTEDMSSRKLSEDEVPHHAEVQAFRKEGSTEMVDPPSI